MYVCARTRARWMIHILVYLVARRRRWRRIFAPQHERSLCIHICLYVLYICVYVCVCACASLERTARAYIRIRRVVAVRNDSCTEKWNIVSPCYIRGDDREFFEKFRNCIFLAYRSRRFFHWKIAINVRGNIFKDCDIEWGVLDIFTVLIIAWSSICEVLI